MENDNPFTPWHNPMYEDNPFAPHNGIDKDNPFKPWNNPFGTADDLTCDERKKYNLPCKKTYDEQDERNNE